MSLIVKDFCLPYVEVFELYVYARAKFSIEFSKSYFKNVLVTIITFN